MVFTESTRIGAIITAAGMSTRMGQYKLLLPFGRDAASKPLEMIAHTIASLLTVPLDGIICITGNRADDIRPVLDRYGVRAVHNSNFGNSAMFDSVQLGVAAIRDQWDGFFLLPADMPLVRAHTLRSLLSAAEAPGFSADAIIPLFGCREGHPPLVLRTAYDAILRHDGTQGLRGAFENITVERIALPDPGVLKDNDTPDDYHSSLLMLNHTDYPDVQTCHEICRYFQTPQPVENHQQAVAVLAYQKAYRLSAAGHPINPALVLAGALLHDVAKHYPHHDTTGAKWLRELNYPLVAQIIETHKNLPPDAIDALDERAVVYWADKHFHGESPVSPDERFAQKLEKYQKDHDAFRAISLRKAHLSAVESKIEQILSL